MKTQVEECKIATLEKQHKAQQIMLKLLFEDARNHMEFQPFVDFVAKSDWYQRLFEYCKKHKKDVEQVLDKHFLIYILDLGIVSTVAPMHINRIDAAYNTEKYQIWKMCLKTYINNRI